MKRDLLVEKLRYLVFEKNRGDITDDFYDTLRSVYSEILGLFFRYLRPEKPEYPEHTEEVVDMLVCHEEMPDAFERNIRFLEL